MKTKKLILFLAAMLIMLMAIPATAGAAEYSFRLPDGYDGNKDVRYPVIYLLPQDGYTTSDDDIFFKSLKNAMDEGVGMNMIIVRPKFAKNSDVRADLAEIVAEIDTNYKTIADPNYRALVGTGAGGYLAYAVGMTDADGDFVNTPATFGSIMSVNGNFVNNPWCNTYGNVYDILEDAGSSNVGNYYIYMDAPVDGQWTNMAKSTNDLGEMIISFGLTTSQNEFTVRPGIYDAAFAAESANRVLDRLTQKVFSGIVSGTVTLDKGVLTKNDSTIDANYTVNISNALSTFVGGDVKAQATISIVDPDTGDVIVSKTDNAETVSAGSSFSDNDIQMSNKATKSATVQLTVELMGAKLDVASANLIIGQEPTNSVIDLMGDWYFNYTRNTTLDMASVTKSDFSTWSVVQPGLDWWKRGFGNINETTVPNPFPPSPWYDNEAMYESNFDYLITGNAYYAREFYVPAGFNMEGAVLSMGYVDDRCEVYLNGKRIGGTGIDENGNSTGESSWEFYTYIPVTDPSVFNIGGTNTIVVRDINDGMGGGGWYSGPIGFYSAEAFTEINPEAYNPRFYEETFESEYAAQGLGMSGTYENPYLIYLPEGYYETDQFYPTVYLLHQYNSTHTSYKTDDVDRLLDEIIEETNDGMIVVIPNSHENSWWTDDWQKMITEELIPHIDSKYRTIDDARYRMTAGCSMGGQGAYGVALRNPNYFSGALSFFGAFSMGGEGSPNYIADNESAEYLDYFAMYFICGNQDIYDFGIPAIQLNQQLTEKGVDHYFFIENGEHNSAFYVPYFKEGVKYVRENMYDGGRTLHGLLKGAASYDKETGKVIVQVEAEEDIKNYFNEIPASSYTNDTTPALYIPLVLEIKLDGKEYGKYIIRENYFDENTMSNIFEYDLDELLAEIAENNNFVAIGPKARTADAGVPEYEDVEIILKGSLFNYNNGENDDINELDKIDVDLPNTGDESNIALYAFVLLASAAMLVIVSRKKARI